jgi:hypothetical protein
MFFTDNIGHSSIGFLGKYLFDMNLMIFRSRECHFTSSYLT